MAATRQLLVFTIDETPFALEISRVERILRAAEITALPRPAENVLGLVNVQGRIVPVVDGRGLFGLPTRELKLSDRFVLVTGSEGSFIIVADDVRPVVELNTDEVIVSDDIAAELSQVEGVARIGDEMIPILATEELVPARISETIGRLPESGGKTASE